MKRGTPQWERWRKRHVAGLEKQMAQTRFVAMGLAISMLGMVFVYVINPAPSMFVHVTTFGALALDFVSITMMQALMQRTVFLINVLDDEDDDLMGRYIRVPLAKHTLALFLFRDPWDLYDD